MNNNLEELKKMPFEQALAMLEEIVAKMESGNLPLDDMISYFEQGNTLKSICSKKLNDLEKKIEVLVKEDSQGGQWQEFDPSNPRQDAAFNPAAQAQSAPQQQAVIPNNNQLNSVDPDDLLF